jgi:hypothetical protein
VIVKAGRLEVAVPSLTLIRMLVYLPTLASAGVPYRVPVLVSNVAQAGLLLVLVQFYPGDISG